MNWFVVTSLFWRKLAVYSYLWSALNITSKVTNISLKAIGLQYCENRTKRRPTTLSPQIKIQLTNSIIVIIIIMNLNEKYNRLISLIWANVNIPSPTVEIKTTEIATHTPTRRHNFVFCFFYNNFLSRNGKKMQKQIHLPGFAISPRGSLTFTRSLSPANATNTKTSRTNRRKKQQQQQQKRGF